MHMAMVATTSAAAPNALLIPARIYSEEVKKTFGIGDEILATKAGFLFIKMD
jgi:hypothetical protein